MNRSLLIVLCNFMLLCMLAMARFDKAPAPKGKAAAQNAAPMTEVAGPDIVSSLKDSLKSEADAKAGLAQLLEERANELTRQRTRTEALEQETSRLQGEEERLERLRKQLEGERDQLRDATIASQAREKLIQGQLAKREEELRAAQANAIALTNEKGIAERDKAVLAEKLENSLNERKRLEGEIATLLVEKREAHAETAKLAANVGELAQAQEKNTEVISQKIRQVTPLSPNEVFDHFRRNRAALRFTTRENGLLGEGEDHYERYTVFVKDNAGRIVTLCETAGTPLRLATLDRLRAVTATMMFSGGRTRPVNKVSFLKADPRIAVFPSDAATAAAAKAQPFSIEDSPLRFPTAVVVTAGGERYGEAPIRVISGTSRYIEVQTSIANVLFGSFVPSEGDLVFSESGNLIGFMVGSGRAICLADLTQTASIDMGAAFNAEQARATVEMLENMMNDDTLPHGRL
jgi:hypothetical protein